MIDMFLNLKVFFSDKPRRPSGLISCKIACVAETESDSEATVYYVIGAILYRTLGVILPAPMWVLLVISTLQLVRFQTTSHLLFLPMFFSFFIFLPLSILSLTSFHLSCIFFFFLCFSRLFLIPTCNSPSVFSLIVSLLLPPALCVCLVIRQMSWIRQKSTFPSMFLCFFCIVMYFWNCAVGFDWVQA